MTTNTDSTWVNAKGTQQLPTLWLFLAKHYGTRGAKVEASNTRSKPADPPVSQCNNHGITPEKAVMRLTCHLQL